MIVWFCYWLFHSFSVPAISFGFLLTVVCVCVCMLVRLRYRSIINWKPYRQSKNHSYSTLIEVAFSAFSYHAIWIWSFYYFALHLCELAGFGQTKAQWLAVFDFVSGFQHYTGQADGISQISSSHSPIFASTWTNSSPNSSSVVSNNDN